MRVRASFYAYLTSHGTTKEESDLVSFEKSLKLSLLHSLGAISTDPSIIGTPALVSVRLPGRCRFADCGAVTHRVCFRNDPKTSQRPISAIFPQG
jgi:hypothetical protein